MSASGAVFPAFIRATYQETADGVPAFERAMQTTVNRARKVAEVSMEDMYREVQRAVAGGRSDFGVAEMRAAAAAADARAQSARQLATAIAATAAAEADYSAVTQVSIASARRLAEEEENAARSAHLNVAAVERMADAARRSNIDITALSGSNVVAIRSTNAHRQAQMMLGQQMQDTAIMMQLGMNPLMIITQQGTQAAFALSQMGGRAAAVGRFLSSPWTAALMIAGTALSTLMVKADNTADALEKVKFSSDAVGDAQGILGAAIDITTGKISTQRQELIALAIAQAKVGAIQAQAKAIELRREVQTLQDPTTEFSGGMGGGLNIRRVDAGARGAISQSFLAGEIDTKTAIQRLDNLRKAGALTDEAFAEAAKSVASLGIELANSKTFEAAERLLTGVGTKSDRGLLLKPKTTRTPKPKADTLAEFGETSAERIKRINEAFDQQPRLIDRAAQASRELDSIIADLEKRKPANYNDLIKQATAAKDVVQDGLVRPYDELIDRQREQLTIGELVLQGRNSEAEALREILGIQRDMGPIDAARRQTIIDNTAALEAQGKSMARLQAEQEAFLSASSGIKNALHQSIADIRTQGVGALGGLVNNVMNTFDNLFADVVTEQLFGDIFRGLDKEITAASGIKSASEIVEEALGKLATSTGNVSLAMSQAADVIAGKPAVANDNGAAVPVAGGTPNITQAADQIVDIVVSGRKAMPNPETFLGGLASKLFRGFPTEDLAKETGKHVGVAISGAAYGQIAGGLILGGNNSRIGSAIGGILGKEAGDALGKMAGGALGKLGKLTEAFGPLGSIAGGILGGALGGLLTSKPKGSAQIGAAMDGDLTVTGVTGNKASAMDAAKKSGSQVVTQVQQIADALGGKVDASRGSVSIGVSGDSYHVDTSGQGRLKKSQGGFDFNDDYEAAVQFATMDLIKDGVITGLRASTQRLIQAAEDLNSGLQKALDFEGVFTRLKAYKDPVGAAMDTLDKEFSRLKKIFEEAGASSAEYAELEELYGIERATAVREAGEKVTASLKSLFDELTLTNDARSLRDRLVEAQAQYSPLAQRVAAGDTSAYDDYSDIARTMLDLQRQISGSGTDYFKLLDEVTALTKTRIDSETNIASIAAARESLFSTSESSMAPMVSATETQTAILKNELGLQTNELHAISLNIVALTRTMQGITKSNSGSAAPAARQNF